MSKSKIKAGSVVSGSSSPIEKVGRHIRMGEGYGPHLWAAKLKEGGYVLIAYNYGQIPIIRSSKSPEINLALINSTKMPRLRYSKGQEAIAIEGVDTQGKFIITLYFGSKFKEPEELWRPKS